MLTITITTAAEGWAHFVNGVAKDAGVAPEGLTTEELAAWEESRNTAAFEAIRLYMEKVAGDNAIIHAEKAANAQAQAWVKDAQTQIAAVTTMEIKK